MSKTNNSIYTILKQFSFLNENWKQIGIIFFLVILISFLFPTGEALQYTYKLNDITKSTNRDT